MSKMIKDQDQETLSEEGNAGRRRLVRGVVAFAPLVLTLRSGGVLAAASCTAARLVTPDQQGRIPGGSPTDVSCINAAIPPVCEGYPLIDGNTKVTTKNYSLVSVQQRGGNYFCGDPRNPTFVDKQVAILSSAGNTSIVDFKG